MPHCLFAVNGQPVGKAMTESKSNLLHRLQPPTDKPTDNDIEKATKEILKNTLQYESNDRPTMKQVMERLSQLKEQIVRIGEYEVIMNEKHMQWVSKNEQIQETAYLGQHINTQQPVTAVRHTTETKNQNTVACLENEYHVLKHVIKPHENIAKVCHFSKKEYEKDGKEMVDVWIIIEHCQFGRLRDYAYEQELTAKQKLAVMIQAGRAVCHLHEQQPVNVVHRCINPWTLLVSGNPHAPVIKLTRFVFATTVDKDDFPFSMQSCVGNPGFIAPEQTERGDTRFTQLVYDISVDVFALGITCLMLLESLKGSHMTYQEGEYKLSWLFIRMICVLYICYICLK